MLPFEEVKRKPEPLTESQVWGAAAPTPVEPEPAWLSVPNEQAWWWHFNGDNYTVPHIFSVMVSNTGTPRYFVQYPDSRWCDEIGGWWLKVEYPNVPTREYMRSSAPAESQGVERAQPVEPAQCPKCKTWHDSADSVSYCLCNAPNDYRVTVDASYLKSLLRRPAAPVEGVERVTDAPACKCGHKQSSHEFEGDGATSCCMAKVWVSSVGAGEPKPCMCTGFIAKRVTDDAPARVEPQDTTCEWCERVIHPPTNDMPWWNDDDKYLPGLCQHNPKSRHHSPAAQPAKHTDDRPAETIPAGWEEALSEWWRTGVHNPKSVAIEDSFKAGWDAAETRIEVLEAALRDVVKQFPITFAKYAALAAPSGVTR